MITQQSIKSQVIALRQQLHNLILAHESAPGGKKHSKRARMVYVTRQLKALRNGVQS